MNGDGSQEHPWEVTNLADLRSLASVAQAGQYAKLSSYSAVNNAGFITIEV